MSTAQEYRVPIIIGAAALVVAILLYFVVISPQGSKLSSLDTQQTQLTAQQTTLQNQLNTLRIEQQKLPSSCANLQKISTQIPSVQNPGDLAAEESSFYNQLTGLVGQSGTGIPKFAWSTTPGTTSSPTSPSSSATQPSATNGVVPVPVSMTITGTFGQMSAFVAGLDSFPRLFVIQQFSLAFGTNPSSTGSSSGGGASTSGPPLWVGGTTTPSGTGPYTLTIVGSIYYTTSPNALAGCVKAAAIG